MIPSITVTESSMIDIPTQLVPAGVKRVVQQADGLLVEHSGGRQLESTQRAPSLSLVVEVPCTVSTVELCAYVND